MGTLIKLWFHLPEGTAGGSITNSWTKTPRTLEEVLGVQIMAEEASKQTADPWEEVIARFYREGKEPES